MTIWINDITKTYFRQNIFDPISFTFNADMHTAVVGNNGAGKSTLLRLLSGQLLPTKGTIIWKLKEAELNPLHLFKYISWSAPYIDFPESLSVTELIAFQHSLHPLTLNSNNLLEQCQLSQAKNKTIAQLSNGMRQRLKLALAFNNQKPLLLLDEPCTNLDETGIEYYRTLLVQQTKNKTVIIASNQAFETETCMARLELKK
jgi:ABC-type multidrug transport system ATPase subunit